MSRKIIILSLVILVVVAYTNILGNRFTNWDDEHLIVKNKAIRSLDPFFIVRNFHVTYPPLIVASHSLDYLFWRLNPVGYHLTDMLLYALAVLVFFFICQKLTDNQRAAFIAAAVFAVYPLHVESVTWLSSRKDGLGVLFYLLGFLAYLRSGERGGRGFLWLSVLLYFCALWSRSLMITLPLALFVYDLLLSPVRRSFVKIVVNKLPFAVPLILTFLATVALDPHNEIRLAYHGGSPYATFLAMLKVLAGYLRMLLLPIELSTLYYVEIPSRLLKIPCLLALAVLLWLLFEALRGVRRWPLFSFSVFWAIVSLLPVLQIVPINVIKADRYLYLPTAALCLLFGAVVAESLLSRFRKLTILLIAALVTTFTVLTVARNAVWRNSISLWESEVARGTNRADVYNNLGIAYTRRARYDEAEKTIKHALRLRPDFASAHNNLANVYRHTGRYDKALEELQMATGLTEDIVYAASGYISMGMVYEKKGEYDKALGAYRKASKLNPVYLDDSLLLERIRFCEKKYREEGKRAHD